MIYDNYKKLLLEALKKDQSARNAKENISQIDRENRKLLKKIIEEIGWPSIPKVGKKASTAAWLIAQHSDKNQRFQKECLKLMKSFTKNKDVNKSLIPYLEDRVLVNGGKKQVFGTQFHIDLNGNFTEWPIKDLKLLDTKRKEYGLEPFTDYKKKMIGK